MATLKLTTNNHSSSIPIPSWFIHDYMPGAMGGYVKVYLYLLTAYHEQKALLSTKDTANLLSMLSSEVMSALEYWQDQKLLTLTALSEEDFEVSFTFTKPHSNTSAENITIKKEKEPTIVASTPPVTPKTYIQQTRPNYSPSELIIYLKDGQIQALYKIAETELGRLLSSSDQQILFGLYDWLHMPLNLIEYLLNHCATRGHTSMRYIEKTAIAWLNDGVQILGQAQARSGMDKVYFKILSEVGLGTQNITKVQKDYLGKWLNEYQLDIDVILEGCRRTSAQTKNPSLRYLDSIFKSWHKNKVASLDDIKKLDDAFASKQQNQPGQRRANSKPAVKQTTFNSIEGRDWDFCELERLEQDRMNRLLNEGS